MWLVPGSAMPVWESENNIILCPLWACAAEKSRAVKFYQTLSRADGIIKTAPTGLDGF